jgi:hypothetical protein
MMALKTRVGAALGVVGLLVASSLIWSSTAHSAAVTPVANDDTYSTAHGVLLDVDTATGLTANDTNFAGLNAQVQVSPATGDLSLSGDGSFQYDPMTTPPGTVSFTYCLFSDAASKCESNTATVTITITGATAENDAYTVAQDGSLTVAAPGVLGNDLDLGTTDTAVLGDPATHGALTLNPDGSFTYAPATDFNGPDSFTYCISFAGTCISTATVAITVTPKAVAPVAVDDSYTTPHSVVLTTDTAAGVLANDTGTAGLTAHLVTDVAHGVLTLNADGTFSYDPLDFVGTTTFTYCVFDTTCESNTATATIVVTGATVVDDAYTTGADTTLDEAAPGVLSNDIGVQANDTSRLQSDVSHGTLTLNGDGSFSYDPNSGFTGTDSFTYCIEFEAGCGTADATVTITITPAVVTTSPTAPTSTASTTSTTSTGSTGATGPTVTGSTVGGGGGTLAETGTNSASLLEWGAVLLAGGLGLVMLGVRRRTGGSHRSH